MQIKVIKTDGFIEEYLHTKVIGTFNNALGLIDQSNLYAAEQFAEAITFYLYQKNSDKTITSNQIHLMIQAILTATGYQNAAAALNDYYINRKLQRRRIEILEDNDIENSWIPGHWNKSYIVNYLMETHHLEYPLARAIASSVEEKVLNLGTNRITRSLIHELILNDAEMMLHAYKQLQI